MLFGWAYEGGWTVANEDGSDEEGGHIVFAGDGVCILSIQVAHRSLRISTPFNWTERSIGLQGASVIWCPRSAKATCIVGRSVEPPVRVSCGKRSPNALPAEVC